MSCKLQASLAVLTNKSNFREVIDAASFLRLILVTASSNHLSATWGYTFSPVTSGYHNHLEERLPQTAVNKKNEFQVTYFGHLNYKTLSALI